MNKIILCHSCGQVIAGDPSALETATVIYDTCDTCYVRMVLEYELYGKLELETRADFQASESNLREVFKDFQQGDSLTSHVVQWLDNELSKDSTPYD